MAAECSRIQHRRRMRYPTEHLYPRGSYSFSTTSTDFDYAIANTSHEGHLVESRVTIFGTVSHL